MAGRSTGGRNDMRTWTGVLEEISSKDWNQITLWSFRIEGEDRWFRTQKTALEVPLGTTITFNERNNQVDLASVEQSTASAEPVSDTAAPAIMTAPTVGNASSTDVSASNSSSTDIGKRIRWQAARRDACSVIVAALHTDTLPWNTNLAKGKRLDMLRGYITELTTQFVEEEND